jgi:pimeloyl-ACP methyl ester carboxylesterase
MEVAITQPCNKDISINTIRLHFLEWGRKAFKCMILLHGSGANAHMWDHFASYSLENFRIIAVDQRGHGSSNWARPPAYSCNDYVNDLDRLVESLKPGKVILMGHSMGALHAASYAATKPDRVAALIYVDIEPCPPSWNKKYLREQYYNLPDFYESVQDFVSNMKESSPYAKDEMLNFLALFALKKKGDGKFYIKFDKEVLNNFDQYDLRPVLKAIKCPTLIIRGAESQVMRREIALEMNRTVTNSRLVEIDHATHQVHTDNPLAFGQAVLDFLVDCNLIAGKQKGATSA